MANNPRVAAYERQLGPKKPIPKPAPTGYKTPVPNPSQAMANLIKEREAYAKKYGSWPTDSELAKERKRKR